MAPGFHTYWRNPGTLGLPTAVEWSLPEGYEERLRETAIYYEVPASKRPSWHGSRPMLYVGLASQKAHMTVYLRALYSDQNLKDLFIKRWEAGGTPLKMGKGCVRFKSLAELDLDLLEETVEAYGVDEFVALQTATRALRRGRV